MDVVSTILLFCVGGIAAMLLDVLWWNVNYKKVEKGLEVLEHYHMGIMLFILAVFANVFYQPAAWFLVGMGFLFIVAEWRQTVEIAGKKVIAGKPFAIGSSHFVGSSIIGAGLSGFLIIISLLL